MGQGKLKAQRREELRRLRHAQESVQSKSANVIEHQTGMALLDLVRRNILRNGDMHPLKPIMRQYIAQAIAADRHERGDETIPMIDWTPFEEAVIPEDDLKKMLAVDPVAPLRVVLNSMYQVIVYDCGNKLIKLSIRRLDRRPIRNWRHLQRIKNELVGPENEAFELFPMESRLTDSANQFFLYCFVEPGLKIPVGWRERLVVDSPEGDVQQESFRPCDLPPDAKPPAEVDARILAATKSIDPPK
jgi:hypothetical protein